MEREKLLQDLQALQNFFDESGVVTSSLDEDNVTLTLDYSKLEDLEGLTLTIAGFAIPQEELSSIMGLQIFYELPFEIAVICQEYIYYILNQINRMMSAGGFIVSELEEGDMVVYRHTYTYNGGQPFDLMTFATTMEMCVIGIQFARTLCGILADEVGAGTELTKNLIDEAFAAFAEAVNEQGK